MCEVMVLCDPNGVARGGHGDGSGLRSVNCVIYHRAWKTPCLHGLSLDEAHIYGIIFLTIPGMRGKRYPRPRESR